MDLTRLDLNKTALTRKDLKVDIVNIIVKVIVPAPAPAVINLDSASCVQCDFKFIFTSDHCLKFETSFLFTSQIKIKPQSELFLCALPEVALEPVAPSILDTVIAKDEVDTETEQVADPAAVQSPAHLGFVLGCFGSVGHF